MKKIIVKFKKMSARNKAMLIVSVLLTVGIIIALPTYAWFTNQKKAAEMYKIQYPNSLYINAAHREDHMYFDLDELDVEEYFMGDNGLPINYAEEGQTPLYMQKTHRLYAFSVSGEGTTKFTLQLAHTNNNELTYTIYEAAQTDVKPSMGFENFDWVHYVRHTGANDNSENPLTFSDDLTVADAYYTKVTEITWGTIKNPHESDSILAKKDASDKYYAKTYGEENLNVQDNAVPTYWQADITLSRSDFGRNSKQFHKYYILEVSWDSRQKNSKETDLIYLAVKRKN